MRLLDHAATAIEDAFLALNRGLNSGDIQPAERYRGELLAIAGQLARVERLYPNRGDVLAKSLRIAQKSITDFLLTLTAAPKAANKRAVQSRAKKIAYQMAQLVSAARRVRG